MSAYDSEKPDTAADLPPCVCCGAPSDCRIWGLPMCNNCAGAWMDASPPDIDPDNQLSQEQRSDEWKRRTEKWARARGKSLRGAA